MSTQTVPDAVRKANVYEGRFVVLNPDGTISRQLHCHHDARSIASRGVEVWKISHLDYAPPIKL